ncbi:MAG TPA: site-2 protease family protein [Actinomycetota bacterium]
MFGNSWRIGRVAGIDVRIDASWTFVALLIGYSFYVQIRLGYRETTFGSAALLAAVAAVLFFGSVFLHELAHALTSLRKGIRVHDITLFIFGGVTRADVGSKTPGDEFTIALVGPLTSLVLGGLCFAAAAGADAAGAAEPVVGTIAYLGSVNVVLGLFNLVPGYPLDGGRLLRSAIWRVSGDPDRATTTAAAIGQGIGWLLVAGGVALVVLEGAFGGLWLAFIGWFLVQAARSSAADVELRSMLANVRAREVMAGDLVPIPSGSTLQEAVDGYFMRYDHGSFPVDRDGRTVGLLTLRAVKRVPRERWAATRVDDAMTAVGDEITVGPDSPMDRVLERLQEVDGGRVLVASDGEVVGIVTTTDLARWLARRRRLEAREPA